MDRTEKRLMMEHPMVVKKRLLNAKLLKEFGCKEHSLDVADARMMAKSLFKQGAAALKDMVKEQAQEVLDPMKEDVKEHVTSTTQDTITATREKGVEMAEAEKTNAIDSQRAWTKKAEATLNG